MKILVTGATGFLGSYLVKALVKEGHEVAILKRSFSKTWRIDSVLDQIGVYDLDRCDLEQPFKECGQFDAVIHTATCYGRNSESVQQIFEANTVFPLKLLEMSTLYNTTTFLNTDTILHKYLNAYALSKNHFREVGKLFADAGKIRFINIKLEHIYGPNDDESKFITYIVNNCLKNIPELKLTRGEQKRDFIYIDDIVAAYSILLNRATLQPKLYQEYEIGSERPVSIKQLVEYVHKLTHSRTILQFGAIPYRANEMMESCTNNKELRDLGWKPKVDLIMGIEELIRREKTK